MRDRRFVEVGEYGILPISAIFTMQTEGHTSLGNVSDIVILEVQDSLGVFDDGTSVRGDKELDRLGHAILRHEGTGLGSSELGSGGGLACSVTGRDSQETAGNLLLLDY